MNQEQINIENGAYLDGIRNGDDAVLEKLILEHRPDIIHYVQSRGGTAEEAKDIFSAGLEVLYTQVIEEDLELRRPLGAYLFSICKYQWLNFFRKKRKTTEVTESVEQTHTDRDAVPDVELERRLLHTYIRELLRRLSKDCQQIIYMRWNKESYSTIRDLLGHGSEGYTRKRKHDCQKRLIQLIREDPRIREIYGE